MPRLARLRALLAITAATAVLAGCTGEVVLTADPPTDVTIGAATQDPPEGVTVLEGDGATALAIAASEAYFASAEIVVITPPEADAQLRAASVATTLGLPVLVTGEEGTADAVATELERLGTRTVLVTGGATLPELAPDRPFLRAVPAPDDLDGLQVVIGRDLAGEVVVQAGGEVAALASAQEPFDWLLVPPSDSPAASSDSAEPTEEATRNLADLPGLPPFRAPERLTTNALVSDGGDGQIAAVGTARAAGAGVVVTTDLASDPNAIATLFGLGADRIVGVGDVGDPQTFAYRARVAATGVDLPGGGQELLDGKVYVGLRGAPGAPELGSLGEQDASATLERLRSLAGSAGGGSSRVVPTAVLLTTVASATPGSDGSYSGKRTLADVEGFVDAARDAGVSVLLTFQPGRQSMVEQVALYDEVLARPNVGVALEPGWRLQPGEVPGSQAGVVAADEVNAVVEHLAALTDAQALPPKMLLVRLATDGTVSDPQNIDASRPQVGVVLEVDGGGVTPPAETEAAPEDPAAPAPVVVTSSEIWARATALPWNGPWGWAQGSTEVTASELFALSPSPVVVTYP
ncbi:hypothetical protein [Serinibacter arcticus]|uniref:Lipoprotein n=1 Tax=Serinibacter arcticus TaxID=1655435 RepID=A0A4Z1E0Z1_9MICO|nr:hypothetical protein [Serinibacter arcticus]TGO04342.1 hypothetical protein SERN_1935 [Serinibacter arcticus]